MIGEKQKEELKLFLSSYENTDKSFIRLSVLYKEYLNFLWKSSFFIRAIGKTTFYKMIEDLDIKTIRDNSNGHKIYLFFPK